MATQDFCPYDLANIDMFDVNDGLMTGKDTEYIFHFHPYVYDNICFIFLNAIQHLTH